MCQILAASLEKKSIPRTANRHTRRSSAIDQRTTQRLALDRSRGPRLVPQGLDALAQQLHIEWTNFEGALDGIPPPCRHRLEQVLQATEFGRRLPY